MTLFSTPDQRAVQIRGYRITAKTGESTGSATYRARREADGLEVAMKMLHTDYTRIADVTRFKHAYASSPGGSSRSTAWRSTAMA